MNNIELIHEPYARRRILLKAYQGSLELGSLDYLPCFNPRNPVQMGLLYIYEAFRNKGVATAILKELCKSIGAETFVATVIDHPDTWDFFEPFNPNLHATDRTRRIIDDPTIISAAPISRVLRSGGIKVIKFNVIYNPTQDRLQSGNNIYYIGFRGITT